MPRRLEDWLNGYMEYASISESPKIFHFWAGVSAVAGALRRHCWFDQVKFQWYPSFFIVFVGPPGIVSKSTTADGSMDLLREVPGIKFGPDEITWQSLVNSFTEAHESFQIGEAWYPQSPLTILSSEFGMYMDFRDTKMVNLHITLWDGRRRFEKKTKASGDDMVEAPWINLLACTTPQWIASNMDANTIGGGFTSRCIFVYGDKKERPVAYLKNQATAQYVDLKDDLIHDLEWISQKVLGEYVLTPEAEAWGEKWYARLWDEVYSLDNEDWVNNYLARKQAHMHKLAMVLAACKRDEMMIEEEDLKLADVMLSSTEAEAHKVFAKVGRSEDSRNAAAILETIAKRGSIPYKDFFRIGQIYFPDSKVIENLFNTFIKAGQLRVEHTPAGPILHYVPDA